MDNQLQSSDGMAAAITKSASKQTYYTIRFLADRDRLGEAYRAYGYFRWVDDVIDDGTQAGGSDGLAFAYRQKALLEACYRGETPEIQHPEEWMLVDLVRHDTQKNSGLQIYLRNMMDVMLFDAQRRGQLISQAALAEYSHKLGKAVTEAMYYFIGHSQPGPYHEARYYAVTGAHVTHMLRDAFEDAQAGYYNVPAEVLATRNLTPQDINTPAYREWVRERVQLARQFFAAGRECTAQVSNWRCRLAGFAYTARFEWMLDAITRDNYSLRADYPQRKSLRAGLWMVGTALKSMLSSLGFKGKTHPMAAQSVRMERQ